LFGLLGLAGALGVLGGWLWFRNAEPADPPPWEGPSTALKRTVVVPTLDTPIPEGKSAVWCASFQAAWNRLKEDVAKGPVLLEGAEEVADRLNRAEPPGADLAPGSFYAAAGFARDGAIERVRKEMATKFPGEAITDLVDELPSGPEVTVAIAYAYLQAEIRFTKPYHDDGVGLRFEAAQGNEVRVASFGLLNRDLHHELALREQVTVLYWSDRRAGELAEFAVDLCNDSTPNQIVLASIPRQQTLAEALAELQRKIERARAEGVDPALGMDSILLVPNMTWHLTHHFQELEGRNLLNASLPRTSLSAAFQAVRFKMNRTGVQLKSQAAVAVKSTGSERPRHIIFHRPFLLYLKKRDAQRPFFVMWVDNAELLQKRE
jgi:hypothetical protein